MTTKLLPSPELMRKIVSPQAQREMKRLIKEVEIYEYLGTQPVPKTFTDQHWIELLQRKTIADRVAYLRFTATKQMYDWKEKNDHSGHEAMVKRLAETKERFSNGEMVYGAGGYQLVQNPTRYRKKINNAAGNRIYSALRSGAPQIAFDLTGFLAQKIAGQMAMSKQVRDVITESFEYRPTLPISFYGLDSGDSKGKEKCLKMFSQLTSSYGHQTILPEVHMEPVSALKRAGKKVVYITSKGKRMLDGPLTADVYVLAAVKDQGGVGFASSRLNEITAYRLPIHRYVEWKSGTQTLPVNNIARILREVYSNGGDWSTALHKNISVDRLRSVEEKMEMRAKFVKSLQAKKRNFDELVAVIQEATKGL